MTVPRFFTICKREKGSLKTDSEKVMLIVVLLLFSAKTFSVLFNIFLTSCSSISFTICIVLYGSANGLFFLVLRLAEENKIL